jgi:hypothetical protein
LILGFNGELSPNPILHHYALNYPDAFKLDIVDIALPSREMELEGSSLLVMNDQTAWVDGDLICPLLLWNYDGMWIDMDSLLTRNPLPSPLPDRARVRHPVGLLRQALLATQRHTNALPRPPRLSLRGLPHHVHAPTAPAGLHRLGIRPLPRARETVRTRRGTAVQDSTALVFFVFWRALCPMASLTDRESLLSPPPPAAHRYVLVVLSL